MYSLTLPLICSLVDIQTPLTFSLTVDWNNKPEMQTKAVEIMSEMSKSEITSNLKYMYLK